MAVIKDNYRIKFENVQQSSGVFKQGLQSFTTIFIPYKLSFGNGTSGKEEHKSKFVLTIIKIVLIFSFLILIN